MRKNLGQNARLSHNSRACVKKGHNFPYVNRCAIVERAPKLLLLLTTRAQDLFSVKHPLMNDRYLLIRKGQKLDEGHNGTTRVAIAFYRLR